MLQCEGHFRFRARRTMVVPIWCALAVVASVRGVSFVPFPVCGLRVPVLRRRRVTRRVLGRGGCCESDASSPRLLPRPTSSRWMRRRRCCASGGARRIGRRTRSRPPGADRDPGDSLREAVPGAAPSARGTARRPDHLAPPHHARSRRDAAIARHREARTAAQSCRVPPPSCRSRSSPEAPPDDDYPNHRTHE